MSQRHEQPLLVNKRGVLVVVAQAIGDLRDPVRAERDIYMTELLHQAGVPVTEPRPIPAARRLEELPELLASLPHLSIDEARSYGKDVADVRAQIDALDVDDPWQS